MSQDSNIPGSFSFLVLIPYLLPSWVLSSFLSCLTNHLCRASGVSLSGWMCYKLNSPPTLLSVCLYLSICLSLPRLSSPESNPPTQHESGLQPRNQSREQPWHQPCQGFFPPGWVWYWRSPSPHRQTCSLFTLEIIQRSENTIWKFR